MGKVLAAGASGLESYVLLPGELLSLDKLMVRYFRVLEQGKACTWFYSGPKSMPNSKIMMKWRILPMAGELAMRRVKWLQQMCKHPAAFTQVRGAVWGSMGGRGDALSSNGMFIDETNLFRRQLRGRAQGFCF